MQLGSPTHERVQDVITRYVAESGISVVGYVMREALTLLRWPDTRPGYHAPSIPECDVALDALVGRLQASSVQRGIVPALSPVPQ